MLFGTYLASALTCGTLIQSRVLPVSFLIIPIIILSALQFEVGTDYHSYYSRAEYGNAWTFTRKFEYGFAVVVWLSNMTGWPQTIFLASSILQYVFTYTFIRLLLSTINLKSSVITMLLLFVLLFYANVAANQLNLLRFYIALPLFGIMLLSLSNCVSFRYILLLVCLSASFHFSFIFLGLISVCLWFFDVKWTRALTLGIALTASLYVVFEQLKNIYSPLQRISDFSAFNVNVGLTDIPLLLSYILLILVQKKFVVELKPFIILHVLMPIFIFGPEDISQRVSYIIYYLVCAASIVLFMQKRNSLTRQLQTALYFVWFVIPFYKFFIFNEREYGYQWII